MRCDTLKGIVILRPDATKHSELLLSPTNVLGPVTCIVRVRLAQQVKLTEWGVAARAIEAGVVIRRRVHGFHRGVWGRGIKVNTVVVDPKAAFREDRRCEIDRFAVEILARSIHYFRGVMGGHE
jgi:hypothetical protein